jgi:TetR/AcrR family transcriptional regulator, cholesterol catabolism regulator
VDDRPAYDEKLLEILEATAVVFAESGFHGASIRDIAAAAGVGLSGLYYYVRSKEEILFLIQRRCLQALLEQLGEGMNTISDPRSRLRVLVQNHLHSFARDRYAMKILAHEIDVLTGEYGDRIQCLRRRYVRVATEVLAELRPDEGPRLRTAAYALLAMMDRVYTWNPPEEDLPVTMLEEEMVHPFLHGFLVGGVDPGVSALSGNDPALGQAG